MRDTAALAIKTANSGAYPSPVQPQPEPSRWIFMVFQFYASGNFPGHFLRKNESIKRYVAAKFIMLMTHGCGFALPPANGYFAEFFCYWADVLDVGCDCTVAGMLATGWSLAAIIVGAVFSDAQASGLLGSCRSIQV